VPILSTLDNTGKPALPSWVDGYVGARFERELGQRWVWTTDVNAGAGGTDFTFGFDTRFGLDVGADNRLVIGLKLVNIDYQTDVHGVPLEINTTFLGSTIGFMFD